MSEPGEPESSTPQSKREQIGALFQHGLAKGQEQLLKGKLTFEHSLGLGAKPNVIPPQDPIITGEQRAVEIGWHPVAGFAGKWFAEKSGLGKLITEKIHKYPDPTQHWAVLVGDYVHQLWMDEHLDVIYINEKIVRDEWHTFEVGSTRFNDEALRQAGEMVIYNMRTKRPAYNLIENNCQTFAVALLDSIKVGTHREFATSFAVWQRAIGKGTIADLFKNKAPEELPEDKLDNPDHPEMPKLTHQNTVQVAEQVMEDNTTKLDNHHSLFHIH